MWATVRRVATLSWSPMVATLIIAAIALTAGEADVVRFGGTVTIASSEAPAAPVTMVFTVNLDPGKSATFEWRFRNAVIFSGAVSATQSGANVSGMLIPTGGLALRDPLCCRPCLFTAVVSGNRVDGTLEPVSCEGTGTFTLFRA